MFNTSTTTPPGFSQPSTTIQFGSLNPIPMPAALLPSSDPTNSSSGNVNASQTHSPWTFTTPTHGLYPLPHAPVLAAVDGRTVPATAMDVNASGQQQPTPPIDATSLSVLMGMSNEVVCLHPAVQRLQDTIHSQQQTINVLSTTLASARGDTRANCPVPAGGERSNTGISHTLEVKEESPETLNATAPAPIKVTWDNCLTLEVDDPAPIWSPEEKEKMFFYAEDAIRDWERRRARQKSGAKRARRGSDSGSDPESDSSQSEIESEDDESAPKKEASSKAARRSPQNVGVRFYLCIRPRGPKRRMPYKEYKVMHKDVSGIIFSKIILKGWPKDVDLSTTWNLTNVRAYLPTQYKQLRTYTKLKYPASGYDGTGWKLDNILSRGFRAGQKQLQAQGKQRTSKPKPKPVSGQRKNVHGPKDCTSTSRPLPCLIHTELTLPAAQEKGTNNAADAVDAATAQEQHSVPAEKVAENASNDAETNEDTRECVTPPPSGTPAQTLSGPPTLQATPLSGTDQNPTRTADKGKESPPTTASLLGTPSEEHDSTTASTETVIDTSTLQSLPKSVLWILTQNRNMKLPRAKKIADLVSALNATWSSNPVTKIELDAARSSVSSLSKDKPESTPTKRRRISELASASEDQVRAPIN
ncbi:hypothetical protein OC835_004139 [Tilletia horrida]|nr:hypothetical protein OC835_004139 [Tilletia horrida]